MSNTVKPASINNQTIAELHYKDACKYATTAELTVPVSSGDQILTNAGSQAIFSPDGINVVLGDRILVKDQSDTKQNGIYIVTNIGSVSTNWVLERAIDFNSSTECVSGEVVFVIVSSGSTNSNKSYFIGIGTEVSPSNFGTTTFSVNPSGGPATQITVEQETSDTTCNLVFTTDLTGDLAPKTNSVLKFNSSSGLLTAGGLSTSGTITGDLDASNITGTVNPDQGGTGQTTYTDGQLLIGNTTGNTLSKSTLTAGNGINITNGNGSITIDSPDITFSADTGTNHDIENGETINIVGGSGVGLTIDAVTSGTELITSKTTNRATVTTTTITRDAYDTVQGYVSQVLYAAAPAGYCHLEFSHIHSSKTFFAGFLPNTASPLASDTQQWTSMYSIGFVDSPTQGVRLRTLSGTWVYSTDQDLDSNDILSITYDGSVGGGTITVAKNGVAYDGTNYADLSYPNLTQTGVGTTKIFHAKLEHYVSSGDPSVAIFQNVLVRSSNTSKPLVSINPSHGTLYLKNGGTGSTTASGARSNLGLGTMATENVAALTNSIVPNTTNSIDLGSASKTFRDLYLSGSSAVIGDITLSTNSSSVVFTNTSTGHPVHNSNVLYHKYFHPSSTDSVALTTSFKIVPTDGELHGTFTTPANVTSVIVEAGAYLIQVGNLKHIYLGLSGHSNRTTYQEIGTTHGFSSHISTEKFISYGYYNRRQKSYAKWHLKNLTGSTSYTINLAAKASGSTCYVDCGGAKPSIWLKVTVPESNEDIEAQNISSGS